MKRLPPSVALINENVEKAKDLGIAQLSTQDEFFNGRDLIISGNKMINFGSCSYLGLELDSRLQQGAIEAVQKYGTQFSCSRSYLSMGLYDELESLLSQIFGHPVLVAPTTTLGHISNIPVLVSNRDAVILDHQVHASVQNAVSMAKANGAHIEMMRHNKMEYLEARIKKLNDQYDKVWYMADGVYSMFGDCAPMKELHQLLNKYENFYLYVDDAHGMSWTGKNGSGYVLNEVPFHEKMVLIASLAKAFGSCGGVMVYPNEKMKSLVRNCGGTMMFSGPVQPAILGASIACARIHLSTEMENIQRDLHERMKYYIGLANKLEIPLVRQDLTPIFFVGVGNVDVGYRICQRVLESGFYLNIAAFPSVPYNNTGLRMTITRHQEYEDIEKLLHTIAQVIDEETKKAGYRKADIFKSFKIQPQKISAVLSS